MKKSLTGMLVLLAGASVMYGQGSVEMGDFGAPLTSYIYVSYKPLSGPTTLLGGVHATYPTATLGNYTSELGNGADWTVQLYGIVGSGTPVAIPGVTATFANGLTGSGNDNVPGTWLSTAIASFTSAPQGTAATLQLAAWYNDGGIITSYATAVADGVPAGLSGTMTVALQAPPNAPGNIPEFANFNVTAVPEPSTIALGVIGASAFLMRLRRKQ